MSKSKLESSLKIIFTSARRPAFGLIPDMVHTCGVPVKALTATVTPDIQKEIIGFLGNCVKACNSMNKPNIAYKVYQLKSTATSKGKKNIVTMMTV